MRESSVEKYLVRRCRERGRACWKFTRPGRNAAFDRVIPMPRAQVIWVETKKSKKDLSAAQRREQQWLYDLGHIALCINSKDDVETFVEEYLFQ
jgi:hypothetical protein